MSCICCCKWISEHRHFTFKNEVLPNLTPRRSKKLQYLVISFRQSFSILLMGRGYRSIFAHFSSTITDTTLIVRLPFYTLFTRYRFYESSKYICYLFAYREILQFFGHQLYIFTKSTLKTFHGCYQSVNQFGSRSGPT